MTEPVQTPAGQTDGDTGEQGVEQVARRNLLRRGAAVAGAAAGAVALGAVSAQPAAAVDGDALKQGSSYTGKTRTSLVVSTAEPALELFSADGPALKLRSVSSYSDALAAGEVVALTEGLLVGAADADETYTSLVATQADLAVRSFVYPVVPPRRLVDTRSASSRQAGIVSSGGAGLDSSGRIKAGGFIDVLVDRADRDFYLDAVFLNLTTTGSTASGYMVAYPPGDKPNSSTLNYTKGANLANSSFTAVDQDTVDGTRFVVRIYSSAPTHVIVDLNGVLSADVAGPAATQAVVRRSKMAARRPAARSSKNRARSVRR